MSLCLGSHHRPVLKAWKIPPVTGVMAEYSIYASCTRRERDEFLSVSFSQPLSARFACFCCPESMAGVMCLELRFPGNSTLEMSLTWTCIMLRVKRQMHASKYWARWAGARQCRNVLLTAHWVWPQVKGPEDEETSLGSLFSQGQDWRLGEPDENV